MKRYLRWLLLSPLIGLLLVGGLNVLVDPYDVFRVVNIDGLNAEKTRRNAEGSRIATGFGILRGGYRTLFLGTSRVQRSFPQQSDAIPGREFNAGMAGANMFEIARAARLAWDAEGLDCVVFGLDFNSFSTVGKIKGSYWNSPLAEGPLWLAYVKSALSVDTVQHAVATVWENRAGIAAAAAATLQSGEPRKQFEIMTRHFAARYRSRDYDFRRMELLKLAVDGFTARGIQVALVIAPIHAWQEEALWRAGLGSEAAHWRRALADLAAKSRNRDSRNPCFQGGAVITWDFAGFQDLARAPVPDPETGTPHPLFIDTSHSRPEVGEAMLARLSGQKPALAAEWSDFGLRLSPPTLESHLAGIDARRRVYLETVDGQTVTRLLDRWQRLDPPEPVARRFYLTPADLAAMQFSP